MTEKRTVAPRPSGRRFSLRNVMVGELRNDKISRMPDYSDVVANREQTAPTPAE